MLPLYREPHFTFTFADDRVVPRFHLNGVAAGRRVDVFRADAAGRRTLVATAAVGAGGWVNLPEPLVVRAGDVFVAVPAPAVSLRPVGPGDLPRMFDLQRDPESNRMAVTIPRTAAAFDAHWAQALADPAVTARAVLLGETLVGYISRFPADGRDHVGYWIDRGYWGRGVASAALRLFLEEVTARPLTAVAATDNGVSLRVLQKCGFVVEQVRRSPATDRYPECEEAVLVLR